MNSMVTKGVVKALRLWKFIGIPIVGGETFLIKVIIQLLVNAFSAAIKKKGDMISAIAKGPEILFLLVLQQEKMVLMVSIRFKRLKIQEISPSSGRRSIEKTLLEATMELSKTNI